MGDGEITMTSQRKININMKVKNLLLVSLATIAMMACSDEDGVINNEGPSLAGKQAKMRLLFSFDGNGGTRTVSKGDDAAGTELEYGASKITVALDYGDNKPLVFVKDLTLTKPDADSKVAVATTDPFQVAAGANVKIYAFVNPKDLAIDQAPDLTKLSVGEHAGFTAETGLAYINEDVAKPASKKDEKSGFLMSGEATIKTIVAGQTTEAEIKVSRVAAKLDEMTKKDDVFDIASSGLTFTDGSTTTIGVKFVGHSYSNLVNDSYVLPVASNFKEGVLQKYIPVRAEGTNDASYRWSDEGITYCLENGNSSSKKQTRVHYKAKVYFGTAEASVEATEDFYIRAVYTGNGDEKQLRVYKSWNALKTAYPILVNEKKADDAYLKNYDIMRYIGGVCYYEAPIETTGFGTVIVRNNWYQLAVSEVSKLGTPTPAPEPEEIPTKLVVKAKIQPWKVQINDIKL